MDVWSFYKKIKLVGRGAFGSAILCQSKKTHTLVVVKELFADMTDDARTTSVGEIQVLSMMRHPNIIAYYDSFIAKESLHPNPASNGNTLMIVMEYADGGTLEEYLKSHKDQPLNESECMMMFSQICLGLHHVHSHNTIHRDLKTSNILISGMGPSKVLKIADFGISKSLRTKAVAETVVGTPSYLSPELCEGKPYEILARKKLFEGSNLPAVVMKIMKGVYEPIPSQYDISTQNLVRWCCKLNPDDRPDMNMIVSVPAIQHYILQAMASMGHL